MMFDPMAEDSISYLLGTDEDEWGWNLILLDELLRSDDKYIDDDDDDYYGSAVNNVAYEEEPLTFKERLFNIFATIIYCIYKLVVWGLMYFIGFLVLLPVASLAVKLLCVIVGAKVY